MSLLALFCKFLPQTPMTSFTLGWSQRFEQLVNARPAAGWRRPERIVDELLGCLDPARVTGMPKRVDSHLWLKARDLLPLLPTTSPELVRRPRDPPGSPH